jgi:hypothetical protein
MRGQGYDGAINMAGKFSGVRTRIQTEISEAYYVADLNMLSASALLDHWVSHKPFIFLRPSRASNCSSSACCNMCVLQYSLALSNLLQRPSIDLVEAASEAETVISSLRKIRQDDNVWQEL